MTQLDEATEKAKAPLSTSTLAPTSDARPSSGVPRAHEPAAEPEGTTPSDGGDQAAHAKPTSGNLKVAPTEQTVPSSGRIIVIRRVGSIGEASHRHGASGSKKISSESESAAEHDDDSSGSDAENYCTAQEDDASSATGSPRDGPRAG